MSRRLFWNHQFLQKNINQQILQTEINMESFLKNIDTTEITYQLSIKILWRHSEGRITTIEHELFLVTVYTPNSKNDLSHMGLRRTLGPIFEISNLP